MAQILLIDLEQIKQEAEKLEELFPSLSQELRLDKAAKNIFNITYPDSVNLAQEHISRFTIEDSGGSDKCTYCDYLFMSSVESDRQAHELMHIEYEKVERQFGFVPRGGEAREAEKKIAHKEMAITSSHEKQLKGALRLMRVYFERSLELAISNGDWSNHPEFEQYIAMLDLYIFPQKAMKAIREKYGKIDGGIDTGMTIWQMSAEH